LGQMARHDETEPCALTRIARESASPRTSARRTIGLLRAKLAPRLLEISSLDGLHLGQPSEVSFITCELGLQKGTNQPMRHFLPNHAAAHDKHVHVGRLTPPAGRVRVVTDPRPNLWNLVCGDGASHAAAADHHASFRIPMTHGKANRFCEVRVVDRSGTIGSQIQHLVRRPERYVFRDSFN
jgi:hypothetical protein